MDDDAAPRIPLTDADLVRLVLSQLDAITVDIEQHASEVGMLLEGLMSLIERHAVEAPARWADLGGALGTPVADLQAEQLERDHDTMRDFGVPLLVARQFYDRLRQRLEHLRSAVGRLPATPALETGHRVAAAELFPFEEELAASVSVADEAREAETEVRVEFF